MIGNLKNMVEYPLIDLRIVYCKGQIVFDALVIGVGNDQDTDFGFIKVFKHR